MDFNNILIITSLKFFTSDALEMILSASSPADEDMEDER
jgi:hypothetical protein